MYRKRPENVSRVLLIDNSDRNRSNIIDALEFDVKSEYIFDGVKRFAQASECLAENQYDVVIASLDLPDANGIDSVHALLAQTYKLPVIILVDAGSESLAINAIELGAEDFISKKYLNDKHLVAKTVSNAMVRHQLNETLKDTQSRERYLTQYDPITKLPNRFLFLDRAFQAVVQSRRNKDKFALFFLDLDRFKSVNDTLGSSVGDEVLRIVGERLLNSVRSSDTVARLGADEFALILRNIFEIEHIKHVAEQVINDINNPITIGRHRCTVGAALGITCYPEHGETPEQLLRNADTAMYKAKEGGHNQYRFFSSDMSEKNRQTFELEAALKAVLRNPETQLSLHYQSKVNLSTGNVTSVEALIRWQHPILGNIPPSQFIPLAEEIGLIEQIDEWVLRQTCEKLIQWKEEGSELVPIAVNISGKSFNQRHFVDGTVIPILNEYQISGEHIEIEITESMILTNIEQVQQRLLALKALGLRISIDDFGTGFSSLSYLSHFPIDTLKIDASFICDSNSNTKEQAVLKTIIALGYALEVNVIAEGVETEAQRKFLSNHGCHQGQGFLWGKPCKNWSPSYTSQVMSSAS